MKTFSPGGVCLPHFHIDFPIEPQRLEPPSELTMLLSQSIGRPAVPIVNRGDRVVSGQCIARADGFVSAALHAPCTGTVTKIGKVKDALGAPVEAIVIRTEPDSKDFSHFTPANSLTENVASAGIVGLGGAAFPTSVKLTPPKEFKVNTLIINGAECEPLLRCDHALMVLNAEEILRGAEMIMEALKLENTLIGIEANKPDAIEVMSSMAKKRSNIAVVPLKTRYPQGGEKELIKALTGREVPTDALPAAVGVIVQNVATVRAIKQSMEGTPLTERIVTITGPSVKRAGNYVVPIGTPIRHAIEAAGGIPEDTYKILLGGPMMGRAVSNPDAPTTKGVNGIVLLQRELTARGRVEPCIRCARCVSVCPMGLEPYLISTLSRLGQYDDARREKIMNCIECGSCSYICPSWRPLLDHIRAGKNVLRTKKQP